MEVVGIAEHQTLADLLFLRRPITGDPLCEFTAQRYLRFQRVKPLLKRGGEVFDGLKMPCCSNWSQGYRRLQRPVSRANDRHQPTVAADGDSPADVKGQSFFGQSAQPK